MTFGGADKTYIGNGAEHPGLGHGGGFRREARAAGPAGGGDPRRRRLLFGGPQPLWSQARYKAPVTNIVLNNRSYNNERNRIWTFIGGRAVQDRAAT